MRITSDFCCFLLRKPRKPPHKGFNKAMTGLPLTGLDGQKAEAPDQPKHPSTRLIHTVV